MTKNDLAIQQQLSRQSKKSSNVSYFIKRFSPKHKKLQDKVNAMLQNRWSDSFIIESLWKDFGNEYSMDNIKVAIAAGRTLTRKQMEL